MPFKGEFAGKTGHTDILKNPDVAHFLGSCIDIPKPSREEWEHIFSEAMIYSNDDASLPDKILAIDGSSYESPVDGRFPSRMIGYLKIGSVMLDMTQYDSVKRSQSRFINPFEVAKLQRDTGSISLALPGAYVQSPSCNSVTESFRHAIHEYIRSDLTRLGDHTLYDTLILLTKYLGRIKNSNGIDVLWMKKCPLSSCSEEKESPIEVPVIEGKTTCPSCKETVFAIDSLRVHEAFSENGSNVEAYNRLMSALEHILGIHYIYYLWQKNPDYLSKFCLLIDGPLAIFGQSAHFHRAIMLLISDIRNDLSKRGLSEPLIIGITKTGRICEHFDQIDELLPPGLVFPITDEYRYKYIDPVKQGSKKNFGDETYYGQDFLVKTNNARRFALCLAYPFRNKRDKEFQTKKSDQEQYQVLSKALAVLHELESDLYENAMIPVVLAHRHASISLSPGGKVLDVLSKGAFGS